MIGSDTMALEEKRYPTRRMWTSASITLVLFITLVHLYFFVPRYGGISKHFNSTVSVVRTSSDVKSDSTAANDTTLLDPVQQQRLQAEQTRSAMVQAEQNLDKLVVFQHGDTILSYKQLKQDMIPLLSRGLVFLGDSTTRILYGFIYCLMEGLYDDEYSIEGDKRCNDFQQSIKQKCGGMGGKVSCSLQASFQSYTNLTLQFKANFHLGRVEGQAEEELKSSSKKNERRIYYFGVPCLHELWSPGGREQFCFSNSTDWPRLFTNFYNSIQTSIDSNSSIVMIGTTPRLCEEKLGNELALVNAFQRRERFHSQGNRKDLIQLYNNKLPKQYKLDMNYTGPVPVLRQWRANHTYDDSMFNDNGAVQCNQQGLNALLRETRHDSFDPIYVDMYNATIGGCNDTPDGRHFYGRSRLRQVSLILKAFKVYGK